VYRILLPRNIHSEILTLYSKVKWKFDERGVNLRNREGESDPDRNASCETQPLEHLEIWKVVVGISIIPTINYRISLAFSFWQKVKPE
jgi:hypothetical protein